MQTNHEKEGAKAFQDGKPLDDCPHQISSMSKYIRIARREWRRGWQEASDKSAS